MADITTDFDLDPNTDLLSFSARQSTALLDHASFEGFLDYIYMVLLNRRPDPEGSAYYKSLHFAGLPRSALVSRLLRSTERQHRVVERGSRAVALQTYARVGSVSRVPVVGYWLVRRYRMLQRLDRIEVNQFLLAHRLDLVRREVAAFLKQDELANFTNEVQTGDLDTVMFRRAFARARRDL